MAWELDSRRDFQGVGYELFLLGLVCWLAITTSLSASGASSEPYSESWLDKRPCTSLSDGLSSAPPWPEPLPALLNDEGAEAPCFGEPPLPPLATAGFLLTTLCDDRPNKLRILDLLAGVDTGVGATPSRTCGCERDSGPPEGGVALEGDDEEEGACWFKRGVEVAR
jgi:hypothetical protein